MRRGGSRGNSAERCRSENRHWNSPDNRLSDLGFRVAQVPSVRAADAPPPAVAPFDEAQARAHQQAWADFLSLPVEKEVELPGGEATHDLDTKFTKEFTAKLQERGLRTNPLPKASPNLNGRCERFIETIKLECLNKFLIRVESCDAIVAVIK